MDIPASTIPIDALGEPAIPPVDTDELSKNKVSPFVYPEPPDAILTTEVTAPPDTITSAVAPSHTADAGDALVLNNFIL